MPSRPKSRPGQLLDGEIMCLDGDGKPQFRAYCSVEANPAIAFDLLSLEGKDLRHLPLIQRKLRMHSIVAPKGERLLYCDHVEQDGSGMFRLVCDSDLEGTRRMKKSDPYLPEQVSWFKIGNQDYSQWVGREELFERERGEILISESESCVMTCVEVEM